MILEKEKKEWLSYSIVALRILGDRDYILFRKILSYLNYSSPGEYLYIESLERDDYLNVPAYYFESTFSKRKDYFFNGFKSFVNTIIDETRQITYKKHENRLFEKLYYGLLNHEFKSLDNSLENLKLKIEKCGNLYSYLNQKGYNNSHYLSHMKMLFNDRLRIDSERLKKSFESSTDNTIMTDIELEDKLINTISELEMENTEHVQLAYFRFYGSKIKLLKFAKMLKYMNYISSVDAFMSVFILPNKIYSQKIIWKNSIASLLYLFKLFEVMELIKLPLKKWKYISETFYTKDKAQLIPQELSRLITINKFGLLTKENINKKMIETSNRDVTEIFQLYSSIFNN